VLEFLHFVLLGVALTLQLEVSPYPYLKRVAPFAFLPT
jgi:hypothetical protein